MNKVMIAIMFGIALISLANATTIIAGDCLSVDLSELKSLDNVTYDVVGNSSNLEGLTIELNNTIANICIVPNYKPDSFTLIFIDNSTKEIIKEVPVHHYSSGGTRTITKEVIKEVPNYIDREIVVEKEVPSEPEIIKKVPIWVYVIIALFTLLALYVLYLIFSQNKSNSLEEEENINEKEDK